MSTAEEDAETFYVEIRIEAEADEMHRRSERLMDTMLDLERNYPNFLTDSSVASTAAGEEPGLTAGFGLKNDPAAVPIIGIVAETVFKVFRSPLEKA